MHMEKVYEQRDWQRHFDTYFREPMKVVYGKLLGMEYPKYDYYIKVDPDAFVRPCGLHSLFLDFHPKEVVVLSTGDSPLRPQPLYGTGTTFDGFFVAHSQASVQKLYQLLLTGSDRHAASMNCAAVMLSGHDETPDDVPSVEFSAECNEVIATVKFSLDAAGYALISGIDMEPSPANFELMLSSQQSMCVPAQDTGHPESDDDAHMITPAANGTDQLCFSHHLALIHAVVDYAAQKQYYDMAYKALGHEAISNAAPLL